MGEKQLRDIIKDELLNGDTIREVVRRELVRHWIIDKGRNVMVVPFPIMYETLSTQLVKRKDAIERFRLDWNELKKHNKIAILHDDMYRLDALDECFNEVEKTSNYRDLSLTDRVIRNMILDTNVRITHLITFNHKDFADACARSSVIMI